MKTETLGLIIGGLVPALCFTVANLSAKSATNAGVSLGPYLLVIGSGVMLVGAVLLFALPDKVINMQSASISLIFGLSWGIGVACISLAIAKYGASIGQVSALFNMNTLFTVLLALWIFAEWKQVKVPQLLIGSLLIVIGGTLVARA